MFIDEIKINVKAGDGGNGCIAPTAKYTSPIGGPSGGNGGRGGSIMLEGSTGMNTLNVFKKRVHIKGNRGSMDAEKTSMEKMPKIL
jgi:GTPase